MIASWAVQYYLLHGADKVLRWFVDVAPNTCGSASLVGWVGAIGAAHLDSVTGFGWPTQLVVHDEVYRKYIYALSRKRR